VESLRPSLDKNAHPDALIIIIISSSSSSSSSVDAITYSQ